jgi:protein O-mannosyl-transferase
VTDGLSFGMQLGINDSIYKSASLAAQGMIVLLRSPTLLLCSSVSRKRRPSPKPTLEAVQSTRTVRRPSSSAWAYAALAILAFGVYATALGNGFVWDDSAQLLKNPAVVDFHKIPAIFRQDVWAFEQGDATRKTNYYRPVQMLVYMGMYYLADFNAFAFHLLMVLIHTANTLLVFFLAHRFFEKFPRGDEAALVGAAIFAVHPIHTEAVAWVAVLPDVLLTLLALLIFALFVQNGLPKRWRIGAYAALFFAALMTKETGLMVLPLLVAYEWLNLQRSFREIWENRALYGSLLLVFCAYLALRWQALGSLAPAQGRNIHLAAPEFALNAVILMGQYLGKLVWPTNLSSYHVFEPVSTMSFGVLLSLAAIVAVGAAIFIFRHKLPLLSFGLCLIVIPLIPVMNLTGIGEAVFAERYLYLPSVGFAWVAGLIWLWPLKHSRALAWIAATVILDVFGYAVMARIPDWHDDIRLYQVTARQYPKSAHVRTMLAQFYQFHGDNDRALEEYRAAVQLDPGNAILHNSLAALLAQNGRLQEAKDEFRKAVALNPSYWPAFVNLAEVLDQTDAPEQAAMAYEKALRLKPDSIHALSGLASVRRKSKDYDQAIELLKRALAAEPTYMEAYLNLGLVYNDLGNHREAASAFRRAIEVGSRSPSLYLAHYGLGVSYVRLNLLDSAADEFAKTLMAKPDYALAQQALDKLRAVRGK